VEMPVVPYTWFAIVRVTGVVSAHSLPSGWRLLFLYPARGGLSRRQSVAENTRHKHPFSADRLVKGALPIFLATGRLQS
jgi:hypothetical protein